MKISGPFHTFKLLPQSDLGHEYMSSLANDDDPKLTDDILMEIYPSVAQIDCYNPSTRQPMKGINTTGPTVIDGDGLKTLLSALDTLIERVNNGPESQEFGGESFERRQLTEHLESVRELVLNAVQSGDKILHLGV